MAIGDDDFSATTAVAVDKDKGSHQAVKWTLDHLVAGSNGIVILHVRTTPSARGDDAEISELFRTYRMFFAKKGIKTKEVLLEDADISRALLEYVHNHRIINIVLGASNRNAITRKFRHADVPSQLLKSAPNFCSVYVIWKGKTTDSKVARSQPSSSASFTPWVPPPSLTPSSTSLGYLESDDSIRSTAKGGWRAPLPPSAPAEWRSFGGGADFPKMQLRDRPPSSARLASSPIDCLDIEPSMRPTRSRDSDDLDIHGSSDFGDLEFSLVPNGSSSGPSSPTSANREMEAEMRRLKLELKQTMDMYSNACKEAITAKQKAKELHQLKLEEARKFEEARQSEEAALAMAELEKARCKAAIEAAQAAQRAAEVEAQKRQNAEMAAKREAEEKKKALDFLAHNNMRYRKYTIDEIEVATEYFAEKLKIGEGGYGPVYQASLDHTPVAIKVLRPDAAQGRKQFQQEVEVLSCIRHPNMVLLLGACPEYGCLVYEFMDYGSLDDRLFRRGGTPPIPWQTRFKIAAEIATALLFLHQTKPEPLVHRDLKPANILLDRNFVSKISDVGLSRLVPPSVVDNVTQYRMTSTAGTFCYIDPEYQQTGMLGTKSDIYSLGILLLQIITARPPMAISHHVERAIDRGTFREMLDPAIEDCPLDEALAFAKIALACAQLRRKDRPDLGTVVLPELNRLRRLGVEKAEGGLGATLSPNVSRPNSGGVPSRAQSETNQEIIHSDSQMATGSKSVTGVETVSPSSSQG